MELINDIMIKKVHGDLPTKRKMRVRHLACIKQHKGSNTSTQLSSLSYVVVYMLEIPQGVSLVE